MIARTTSPRRARRPHGELRERVGNYVSVKPLQLGNSVSADTLSMFDPIYLGIDEFGEPVYLHLVYRNLLAGGEPGGGKSGLLNTIAAHAALSTDRKSVV